MKNVGVEECAQIKTSPNSASNAIPNCKAPETPHYSLVQRAVPQPVVCNKLVRGIRAPTEKEEECARN